MQPKHIPTLFFLLCILLTACSKKHQPQSGAAVITTTETVKPAIVKRPATKLIRTAVPKVLTINGGMQKSVDGRLYYDLEGRRYWKNYDDGKYYLFNKNMFGNPAYKPH